MKLGRHLGMRLLAIWLIVDGIVRLIGLHFNGLSQIMAVLALVAGVLLLIGK